MFALGNYSKTSYFNPPNFIYDYFSRSNSILYKSMNMEMSALGRWWTFKHTVYLLVQLISKLVEEWLENKTKKIF